MTATANAIIQDADSVGTALKTTSLRLRGTDSKLLDEEGLDSEGAITSKSKLQSKVKALSGVDILTATGEYKSTYEILSQIADVWSDINDMDQAALLELISGKRNSSVIAAILQSPEALKAAYEDAQNAEGSALKENEKYLDSIQGRIDLFTNSVQTMWSNFIDSDVVKFVVDLGTKVIKFVDNVGLLKTALAGIFIYLTAFKKQTPLALLQQIWNVMKNIYVTAKANGIGNMITSLLGMTPMLKAVNAEMLKNTVLTQANDAAKAQNIISTMGLSSATGTLTPQQREAAMTATLQAMSTGQLTMAQGNAILAMMGYSAATVAADGSLKALDATTKSFMATNPIGWILAIVSVLMTIIMLISKIPNGMEKISKELTDLRSDISGLESEINSINSELKTTQDRISELLALPSLSIVEQEELNNLMAYNDELERNKKIKEDQKADKEKLNITKTDKYIDKYWSGGSLDKKYYVDSDGVIREDDFWNTGMDTKSALDSSIRNYEIYNNAKRAGKQLLSGWDDYSDYEKYILSGKSRVGLPFTPVSEEEFNSRPNDFYINSKEDITNRINNYDEILGEISNGVSMVFSDENLEGLSYGMSDTIDKFLDEQYAYRLKLKKAEGQDVSADAISSMFDATSSKEMQALGKELQAIADDSSIIDKNQAIIDKINGLDGTADAYLEVDKLSDSYNRLKTTMDIVGTTAQDISDYYVLKSGVFDSDTIEGITSQYQKGIEVLKKYKDAGNSINAVIGTWKDNATGEIENITWKDLFDDGDVIESQISKVLQGADETTRTEFARIVKSINESKIDIDEAMASFSGSGLVAVSKLIEESFGELNKSVFKGLEDEISGFIDTFSEFSAALEDVANSMDLLNAAQEQYKNSGQVSVKTALELVETTDRWNEILYVENGQIKLNSNAQDVLVQSKLDTVKANLAEAKSSIQNQLAQLGAADAALFSAEASDVTTEAYTIYTNAMNSYTASIAGFGAAIDALVNGRIFGEDGIIESFQSAYNNAKTVIEYENNTNIDALREQLAEIQTIEDFFEPVDTVGEFLNNYDFDKTPGDKKDDYESTDDRFQKEMDYWENRIAANQAKSEQVQNEIDLMEKKGQKADEKFYYERIKLEKKRMRLLNHQKKAAKEYLDTLSEGSDEWWEAANVLNDIENELDDVTSAIVDLQDAIGEINTYKFDEFNTRLDNLVNKLDTIGDLIAPNGEEDWFDDNGDWTEAGVAVLGRNLQKLELYKQGYKNTADELAKYQPKYTGNELYYESLGIHSEQEYYDATEKLINQQYDYAELISNTEQSIVDMYESNIDAVEKYIDTLVDSYNDYIDSVKEALDAERDLYDFKKNVQKQAKDISDLERKITSLSGSTNKADIAERRKLEQQLYESRESLNDTYYDHAQEAQQNALDSEAQAYEETMTKFVEGLRTSLDEATANMDEFLMGVTSMVMYNADTILAKYEETNLPLTKELTNPWIEAKKAVGDYSGNALDLMNQWTREGGFFAQFNSSGTSNLISPWSSGTAAANIFKSSVANVMSNVVNNISSNVKTASNELSKLYQQIQDTAEKAASAKVSVSSGGSSGGGSTGNTSNSQPKPAILKVDNQILSKYKLTSDQVLALGYGPITLKRFEELLEKYEIKYSNVFAKAQVWNTNAFERSTGSFGANYVSGPWAIRQYAKGTLRTKKNEWAITDEPQFGDELVLVPTEAGNLSYMRKGTGVVPAELTANLMEWGKFTPDSMNFGGGVNVNMINNAVTKPNYELNFDSLVHVDAVNSDTLPKLEKMVDKKIDEFSRALNYSIKKFAR